jgi:hypothetical protein
MLCKQANMMVMLLVMLLVMMVMMVVVMMVMMMMMMMMIGTHITSQTRYLIHFHSDSSSGYIVISCRK